MHCLFSPLIHYLLPASSFLTPRVSLLLCHNFLSTSHPRFHPLRPAYQTLSTALSDVHKDALAKRILQIRAEAEATDNKFDKEKSIERVAALGGGRSLIDDHPPSTVESLH